MVDGQRFDRVWKRHAGAILRYSTFSSGSRRAGEDLAAETFARFLARGEHIPDDRVESWLFAVARNLCISHHRAELRDRAKVNLAGEASLLGGTSWGDRDLWSLVAGLGERERLIIYLHIVEDREFSEVASALGRSTGAVKMTYYRALKRLRRDIARSESASRGKLGRESDA